jgi:SAM-dependent methyltransferase
VLTGVHADRIRDDVRTANRARYESPDEVASYTIEPYHQARLDIAARLMAEGVLGTQCRAVVEVGAGGPAFVRRMSELGVRVAGLDIELEACLAIRPLPAACADVSLPLPLKTASVSGLFMGELIEHIYDTEQLLRECHRVLEPGGYLVLTTPNLAGLQDRLGFLLGRSPRHVDAFHDYLKLHIRPFTRTSLRAALAKTGFGAVDIRGNHVVFRWENGRRVRIRWAARLIPGLAGSLIAGARKE